MKPAPLTVRLNAGAPATALCGERLLMDKALVTVKTRGDGCGLESMLTDAVPVEATSDAGTLADSCVAERKLVARVAPFQVTCVPGTKFAPLTMRLKPGLPATVEFGERLVSDAGLMIWKRTEGGEVCPETVTDTSALPGATISVPGTMAVNLVSETNVVFSALPFHVTWAPELNPAPFTVRTNVGPPANVLCGEMLLTAIVWVMTNVRGAGSGIALISIEAVPGDAISAAGITAVSCPEFTTEVMRLLLFQVICVPGRKFAPLTVSVKSCPPVKAEFGERLVSIAGG